MNLLDDLGNEVTLCEWYKKGKGGKGKGGKNNK